MSALREIRGLLVGAILTLVGSVIFFLFQQNWREQANLFVEVRPNDVYLPDLDADSHIAIDAIRDRLNDGRLKVDESTARYINGLVKLGDRFRQISELNCVLDVSLMNHGSLPAEDVFFRFGSAIAYAKPGILKSYDYSTLSPIKQGTIQLGTIRQNTSERLIVFSASICPWNSNDFSSGYKSGSSKIRYIILPTILPDFMLDYPILTTAILYVFLLIAALLLLAKFADLIQRLFSDEVAKGSSLSMQDQNVTAEKKEAQPARTGRRRLQQKK